MNIRRNLLLVILACVLPGAAAYVVVRSLIFPPTRYVILPTAQQRAQSSSAAAVRRIEDTGVGERSDRNPNGERVSRPPVEKRSSEETAAAPGSPAGPDWVTLQPSESNKYMPELARTVYGIIQLEQERGDPLDAQQARAVLAAIEPLRDQPAITQPQARAALRALRRALTIEQRTWLVEQPALPAGMGPAGNSQPTDRRQPPGEQRPPRPAAMKGAPPFNGRGGAPGMMVDRGSLDALIAMLEARIAEQK
jgi:hypothetical protein